MSEMWSEDQTELLNYSLQNILTVIKDSERFKSNRFFIATPFSQGYRIFDLNNVTLQDTIFDAFNILKEKEIDRVNVENADGFPILTIYLEPGPTIIIEDIVTGKVITTIQL
jgi:hypothetical protein